MIAVIDYDVGNLGSVTNGLRRVGEEVVVTNDPEIIRKADGVVLPGVGAFPAAMEKLKKYNLIDILNEVKENGTPILGICLGMQLLFEKSYEVEECNGLGFLEGEVVYMDIDEKVPHMGWNELIFNQEHPLLKYIKEKDYVYFVHSYYASCPDTEIAACASYGGLKVPGLVFKDNVMGCQFHPEKSGEVGKKILQAFKELIHS